MIGLGGSLEGSISPEKLGVVSFEDLLEEETDMKHCALGSRGVRGRRLRWAVACFLGCMSSAAQAQFGGAQAVPTGPIFGVNDVHAADLDGDGDLDLIVCGSLKPSPAWHENLGQGVFGPPQLLPLVASQVKRAVTADFDLDGDVDVLVMSEHSDQSGVEGRLLGLENKGGGVFNVFGVLSGNGLLNDVLELGDIDGDGDADIIYGGGAPANHLLVRFAEPTSSGMFLGGTTISSDLGSIRALKVVDLDGDSDLDFVVGASPVGPNEVVWFENLDGLGMSGPKQILNTTTSIPGALEAADFDRDGDLDIVAGSAGGNDWKLDWNENLGSGNFGASSSINSTGFSGLPLQAFDVDLDGYIDVIAGGDGVSWYANDGQGGFGSQQPFLTLPSGVTSDLEAADINGDGVTDLVVGISDGGQGTVMWFPNETSNPWVDLGFGLEGVSGVPVLEGFGPMTPGAKTSVILSGAAPAAVSVIVVAFNSTPIVFKCGTLVPVPILVADFVTTDALGRVTLELPSWPTGLSGQSLYLQYAIQDASAVCTVSLSNALVGHVP